MENVIVTGRVYKDFTYHLPWVGIYGECKRYFATQSEAVAFARTGEIAE
nr:MAG TPA: hypothetical protein [Caudoviricetes sp.]